MLSKTINNEIKKELYAIKNEMLHNLEIEFCKIFLQKSGLSVGDIVNCYFSYSSGNAKQSYHTGGEHEGVIVEKDNGIIVVASKDKKKISHSATNGRTGRYRKDWWGYTDEIVFSPLMQIK
jgi:hypothetical protein